MRIAKIVKYSWITEYLVHYLYKLRQSPFNLLQLSVFMRQLPISISKNIEKLKKVPTLSAGSLALTINYSASLFPLFRSTATGNANRVLRSRKKHISSYIYKNSIDYIFCMHTSLEMTILMLRFLLLRVLTIERINEVLLFNAVPQLKVKRILLKIVHSRRRCATMSETLRQGRAMIRYYNQ
jgi:hypothetical protein